MTEYSSNNPNFESIIKYTGYQGVGLDGFTIQKNKNIEKIFPIIAGKEIEYKNIREKLEALTLSEALSLAKDFLNKYFNLHEVNYVEEKTILDHREEISRSESASESYEKVNALLESKDPLSLPIHTKKSTDYLGRISKPLLIVQNGDYAPNRKIYFSHISIGEPINLESATTLVHEGAHLQQESNIGYAQDYLNKELISLFLERIAAQELDKTGELLKVTEYRLMYTLRSLYLDMDYTLFTGGKPNVDDLLYYKSTLYSMKLFDNYCKERKQKDRDKYFSDIQDVFDAKITVEDLIKKRNITTNQCMDQGLLGRHI